MRKLVPLLLFCVLAGCGVQDPTTSIAPTEPTIGPPASDPAGSLTRSQRATAGTRPTSSAQTAAARYANLVLNFSTGTTPKPLHDALALSTKHHAPKTNKLYGAAVATREAGSSFSQGDVVATTVQRASGPGAIYLIARTGDYTRDGVPVGTPKIVVYSLRVVRRGGGYLVDRWELAR